MRQRSCWALRMSIVMNKTLAALNESHVLADGHTVNKRLNFVPCEECIVYNSL